MVYLNSKPEYQLLDGVHYNPENLEKALNQAQNQTEMEPEEKANFDHLIERANADFAGKKDKTILAGLKSDYDDRLVKDTLANYHDLQQSTWKNDLTEQEIAVGERNPDFKLHYHGQVIDERMLLETVSQLSGQKAEDIQADIHDRVMMSKGHAIMEGNWADNQIDKSLAQTYGKTLSNHIYHNYNQARQDRQDDRIRQKFVEVGSRGMDDGNGRVHFGASVVKYGHLTRRAADAVRADFVQSGRSVMEINSKEYSEHVQKVLDKAVGPKNSLQCQKHVVQADQRFHGDEKWAQAQQEAWQSPVESRRLEGLTKKDFDRKYGPKPKDFKIDEDLQRQNVRRALATYKQLSYLKDNVCLDQLKTDLKAPVFSAYQKSLGVKKSGTVNDLKEKLKKYSLKNGVVKENFEAFDQKIQADLKKAPKLEPKKADVEQDAGRDR